MQLFYSDQIMSGTSAYTFPREESKHIVRVLRKKEGDTIHITNGKGSIFKGSITLSTQNKCIIKIIEEEIQETTAYKLHIAVAPTKNNDRFEWFLEKATEIGIHEITPLLCDHSERKTIKEERFQRIIQSALKQSLQAHLPVLNPLTTFEEFVVSKEKNDAIKCIAHCEEGKKNTLKNTIPSGREVIILIGPEGDFSEKEISFAMKNKYLATTLGSNRLRTETAALTACQMVAFINEV